MQYLNPSRATWHIAFGAYGMRLHHGPRLTFDTRHNLCGAPFLPHNRSEDEFIRRRLTFAPGLLTEEQLAFVEDLLPVLCDRGGWDYRIGSATGDQIQLLCDVNREIHGRRVRRLVKRWLTQALCQLWPRLPRQSWWAAEGSSRAISEHGDLNNCFGYILRQRATPAAVADTALLAVQ